MTNRVFNKIFQIGFNKCGTVSIHQFFLSNGLKSVHYDNGQLASVIDKNHQAGNRLLQGYEEYDCYTDMESLVTGLAKESIYAHVKYFKELDVQYPNSKFILNQRDIDDWIKSRRNHLMSGGSYLEEYKKIFGFESDDEAIVQWEKDWYEHEAEVKNYFKDRPEDLLIFDIKNEPGKFIDFMSKLIDLRFPILTHEHKTIKHSGGEPFKVDNQDLQDIINAQRIVISQQVDKIRQQEKLIAAMEKSLIWKILKKFDKLLDLILGQETFIRKAYKRLVAWWQG